jgi:hypothetical protein
MLILRFVVIPVLFAAFACGLALHDAIKSEAPMRKRLVPGLIGALGVGGFLYLVIRVYVLSYWD